MPQKKKEAANTAVQQATISSTKTSLGLAVALLIFSGGLALISLPYNKNTKKTNNTKYSESCENLTKLCSQKDYKNQKEACLLFLDTCIETKNDQKAQTINNNQGNIITTNNPNYWNIPNSGTIQYTTPTPGINLNNLNTSTNSNASTTPSTSSTYPNSNSSTNSSSSTASNFCNSFANIYQTASSTTSSTALHTMNIQDVDGIYNYQINDGTGRYLASSSGISSCPTNIFAIQNTDLSNISLPLTVYVTDCNSPNRNICSIGNVRP